MTLVLIFEGAQQAEGEPARPLALDELRDCIKTLPASECPLAWSLDRVVAVQYGSLGPTKVSTGSFADRVRGIPVAEFLSADLKPALFPAAALAFEAAADGLLDHADVASRIFALHVTRGAGAGTAEIERAAGILKTAMNLRGAPGLLWNLWLTETQPPFFGGLPDHASPFVKSLHRMASPWANPAGEPGCSDAQSPRAASWSAAGHAAFCDGRTPEAERCVEAAPSLRQSRAARLLAEFLSRHESGDPSEDRSSATLAFLLPKDGERLSDCQDALSIHATSGRIAISDGAGTASYSAEWARALCGRAVLEAPSFPACAELQGQPLGSLPEPPRAEALAPIAAAIGGWLGGPLEDWSPEVPWERLLRPAVYNKAKAGSGATLAGWEFTGPAGAAGVGYRAWALGDSCVLHVRQGALLYSRPIASAAAFGYDPKLLMTRPGFEEKYALAWQEWTGVLESGDWLMLATDAFSEHLLRRFESGTPADLLAFLDELAPLPGPERRRRFTEYAQRCRADGSLRNDDVAFAAFRWRSP